MTFSFQIFSHIYIQEEYKQEALDAFRHDVLNNQFLLNVEYHSGSQDFVSILTPEARDDVSQKLISDGLVLAENRREKRLNKMVTEYKQAQESARKNRVCFKICLSSHSH